MSNHVHSTSIIYKEAVENVKIITPTTTAADEANKLWGETPLTEESTFSSPSKREGKKEKKKKRKKSKRSQTDPVEMVADDKTLPSTSRQAEESSNSSTVPRSQKNDDEYKLGEDVYSLVFAYAFGTPINLYALLVIGFELTMMVLLYFDLTRQNSRRNRLQSPLVEDNVVCAAKAMALPLAVFLHDDFTESLHNIGAQYDPRIRFTFPTATRTSWMFVSFLRFTVGFSLVFLSFIQVVQASTITDIFINLEAMVFIGHIDNLGFWLAEKNFLTSDFRDKCEVIHEVTFPPQRSARRTYVRRLSMYLTVGSLLVGYFFVLKEQKQHEYLEAAACPFFSVAFGEQSIRLDPKKFEVQGTIRNNTIQLTKKVAELMFSSFNGVYEIAKDSDGNVKAFQGRPYYIEATNSELPGDDGSLGRFQYCKGRWYFIIPALTNAVVQDPSLDCAGWLLRSPKTTAATLEDVGSSGWNIWTGNGAEDAQDFTFSCAACSSDMDCFYGGYCNINTETCVCNPDRFGIDCRYEAPCSVLDWAVYGSSSYDYTYRNLSLVGLNGNVGVSGDKDSLLLLYDRPVYVHTWWGDVLFYMGSRWIIQQWDNTTEFFRLFLSRDVQPHTFWDSLNDDRVVLYYSQPTTNYMPSGGLTWYHQMESRSRGDYGSYLVSESRLIKIKCSVEDCEGLCGDSGDCINGKCQCRACFGGLYCEFSPYEAYAQAMFSTWSSDDSLAVLGYEYYTSFLSGMDFFKDCFRF